jgi:hypothetical protein
MTIQFADAFDRLLLRIVEDVPVQVDKFFISGDFIVMEMEEDKEVSIILERAFLRTAGVITDMRESMLTIRVGDEHIQFQFDKAIKYSCEDECCFGDQYN